MTNPAKAPRGLYVFLVYTIDHELLGAFGAREDADYAAINFLNKDGAGKTDIRMNFNRDEFWSWYNESGEVTIEMTKLQ